MIAKFRNPCCVCGEEFVPGESEIEQHPTMRGPKGGKKYMHAGGDCPHGGQHSHEEMLANPFRNAGRRMGKPRWDEASKSWIPTGPKPGRKPQMAKSAGCNWSEMHREALVEAAEKGDEGATAELARRGRGPDGIKLAWKEGKKKKGQQAANNPFGRGYGYSF